MHTPNVNNLRSRLSDVQTVRSVGRVFDVDGASIWVNGLADTVSLGDQLRLLRQNGVPITGEVVQIKAELVCMVPECAPEGVARGDRVAALGPVGLAPAENWIGRVVDAFGRPLDGAPLIGGRESRGFAGALPAAASRRGLGARLETGLAAFDTVLPIAKGQRIGLFAGSGVGKSSLLGQLARNMTADLVVLALVGERGREVQNFVNNVLGPEGMQRSVVVAATSDRSPMERRRCVSTAMTIAEHFRDQGQHVLLLADSVTRFAEAHREISAATGELPVMRGYPASVVNQITRLTERAGPGISGVGDITAVFSVLVAGSDMDEPIADILRGVLDGHVVLDRKIAERGRFPAINLLRSVSRSLPDVATEYENTLISGARKAFSLYAEVETMLRAGLYSEGDNVDIDNAIKVWPELDRFLAETSQSAEMSFKKLDLILRRGQQGKVMTRRQNHATPGQSDNPRQPQLRNLRSVQ